MLSENHHLTWRIEDFQAVRNSSERINAEKLRFVGGATIGLKAEWEFSLDEHPNYGAEEEEEKPWIGIKLVCLKKPTDCDSLDATVCFRIRKDLTSGYFSYPFSLNTFQMMTRIDCDWTDNCIIRKDEPLERIPLLEGALVLELKVTLYAPALLPYQIMEKFMPRFVAKLQADLTKALNAPVNKFDSETKIILTHDQKEFSISRGVLSARSPVFEKMFETKMEESETGIVYVADINSSTMKVLLQFLYTAILLPEWSNDDVIVQLVYAASKYQLLDLLEFLDHAVGGVCTEETGARLLKLAKLLELKKAEREVFEFIHKRITNVDKLIEFSHEFNTASII